MHYLKRLSLLKPIIFSLSQAINVLWPCHCWTKGKGFCLLDSPPFFNAFSGIQVSTAHLQWLQKARVAKLGVGKFRQLPSAELQGFERASSPSTTLRASKSVWRLYGPGQGESKTGKSPGWGGEWIVARKGRNRWQWCCHHPISLPGLGPPSQVHLDFCH